jgi:hypothetical protein
MKNILFSIFCLFFVGATLAQTPTNDKYTANFRKAMTNLDSSWMNPVKMRETANQFERLANFKQDDWMPRYYHALCMIQLSWTAADMKERENILKAAETSIKAAAGISPDNSEIVALEGNLYQAMIVLNPMANGPVYGPKASATLQKAMALDPNNPRPHYIEGSFIYFTPEQWGGGLERAKPYLEKAKTLFATFKPASEFAPNWGDVPNQMILDGKMPKN